MDVEYGHYTTIAGLMGIVKNECLWATNIKFLNDEHEFQYALGLIKELLPTSRISKEEPDNKVHKEFLEDINFELDGLDNYQSDSVFTLSFTEQTDLLSQWRGYCPANNGYCVVFDVEKILEEVKKDHPQGYLVKCVYDIDDKHKQLKQLLNEYWRKYDNLKTDTPKKERRELLNELANKIQVMASYFKHPSFAEEHEHRIVIISDYDNPAMRFREGRFSIIPYMEIRASRKLIKRIIIGPTAQKGVSERALGTFLDHVFRMPIVITGQVDISHSKTPYRPW